MEADDALQENWEERDRSARVSKIDRSGLIDRHRLAPYLRVNAGKAIGIVWLDYSLIVMIAVVCERYWSPMLYLVALMAIGARQVGIGTVGLHDGAHRLLCRNRQYNDFFAELFTRSLFVAELQNYRKVHFEHHRLTNTDNDPDFKLFTAIFSMSPRAKLLGLLRTLSGIDFILKFVNDFKNASLLRRCLIAVAVMAIIAGLVGSVYPIKLFVLYWLIPFATWGSFVNVVRVVTEHYPPEFYRTVESRENIFLTRDVSLSWFDSIFVMTRGNNYHLTHHLFPSVPFFRLGKLHKEIAASDVYRRSAHVTHGYHRALMEVIFPERYSNPSSLL